MAEHDVVIRGGTVKDGTGSERRSADVALDGAVMFSSDWWCAAR